MKNKKTIAWLLVFILLIGNINIYGVLDIVAIASGGGTYIPETEDTDDKFGMCGDNITWSLDTNGKLTLSGTGEMTSCHWKKTAVKSVEISDGITNIYPKSFMHSKDLISVHLPDSITTIGDSAFHSCVSLEQVNIPENVTSIEAGAFYYCKKIKKFIVPDGVSEIGNACFGLCENLKEVVLPKNLKSIDSYAFNGSEKLSNINIPDSVTYIGDEAFTSTAWLNQQLSINPILIINNMLVKTAPSTSELNIPNYVTRICGGACAGRYSLKKVLIPNSVTSIGAKAFDCCFILDTINFPNNIAEIGIAAFQNCYKLDSISIPTSISKIEDYAFVGCTGLTEITIPNNVKEIGEGAFRNCTNLNKVVICNRVEKIGDKALGYYYSNGKDVKVENLKIYCYKNTAGEIYSKDNGFEYELIDLPTLDNPHVSCFVDNDNVLIEWDAVPGAEEYGIAGYVNNKWRILYQTTETFYVLKNLKANTHYKVAVITKVNGNWNESYSNAIEITTRETNTFPVVTPEVQGRQFRLKWTKVSNAEKYGIAVYQSGGWRVKVQTNGSVTSYTSPKMKSGTYKMVVCAKVGGKWDISNLKSRAFTVTIK